MIVTSSKSRTFSHQELSTTVHWTHPELREQYLWETPNLHSEWLVTFALCMLHTPHILPCMFPCAPQKQTEDWVCLQCSCLTQLIHSLL